MISMTYEQVAKPHVSVVERNPGRKWRRKPLESLKTDSEMAPAGSRSRARRIDEETFVSVLDHGQVRRGRVLHPDDMISGVDVDNFAGDPTRHGGQKINRAVANLLDSD